MLYERLTDMILFSLAVAFTIIGIHQSMVNGIAASYWIFMLVFSALIAYNYRKIYLKKKGKEEQLKSTIKSNSLKKAKRK